jgi:hypothetical protein
MMPSWQRISQLVPGCLPHDDATSHHAEAQRHAKLAYPYKQGTIVAECAFWLGVLGA